MKTRKSVWVVLAMMAPVGCTLTQSGVRKENDPIHVVGTGLRTISPKRCALRIAIVARPANEEALHEGIWRVADAQAIDDDTRSALAANGLRVGLVTGDLPAEVQAVLDAPPPNRIEPTIVVLNDGDATGVQLRPDEAHFDLFQVNAKGQASGKAYKDVKGLIRLTAHHDGPDGVKLRIVPELHHGPIRQDWVVSPGGTFGPRTFVRRDGQQEDTLRDLASELTLRPGQVAVLGTIAERKGTVGHFLFTQPDGHSDRVMQKVVFVWASPSDHPTPDQGTNVPGLQEIDPPDMPFRPSPMASAAKPQREGR